MKGKSAYLPDATMIIIRICGMEHSILCLNKSQASQKQPIIIKGSKPFAYEVC